MNWRKMVAGSVLTLGLLTGAHSNAQLLPPMPPCPGDKVVWVNTPSRIYHYQGERYFGNTKQGKFMCERAALAEGDRATHNGQ
jgi:hypothetical protein